MLSKLLNETGLDGLLRRKTIIIFVFIISKNWCVITAESVEYCNRTAFVFFMDYENTKLTFTNYSFAMKMNLRP